MYKSKVSQFLEKPSNQLINGGFFVFTNKVFNYLNLDKV